jgi:hypothetical protein
VLFKLEVNCSKLHKDACALSNGLQADENNILKETSCYNCVNEFPANGADKFVADPAAWGPHV